MSPPVLALIVASARLSTEPAPPSIHIALPPTSGVGDRAAGGEMQAVAEGHRRDDAVIGDRPRRGRGAEAGDAHRSGRRRHRTGKMEIVVDGHAVEDVHGRPGVCVEDVDITTSTD